MSVMYLDSRKYKEPSQNKERPKGEITQPPLKYPAVVLPWAVEATCYVYNRENKRRDEEKGKTYRRAAKTEEVNPWSLGGSSLIQKKAIPPFKG